MKSKLKIILFLTAGAAASTTLYACLRNIAASAKGENRAAVDELLSRRLIEKGNVELPADRRGLLYNKGNREYASVIIKNDLGANTRRTVDNISSEIFAHEFVADIFRPFKLLGKLLPARYDIYGRVVRADIDEKEKRLGLFNIVDEVFEHE